jgi:hypothetical protein
MLLRLLSFAIFICWMVPVSIARQILQSSPFGRRAYRAASNWDNAGHGGQGRERSHV